MPMLIEDPVEEFISVIPASSFAVANWFIHRSRAVNRDGSELTHTKLQKMVYFAHALHLARFDQVLVNEPVEAWQYGPVFSELFVALRDKNVHAGREYIKEFRQISYVEGYATYKTLMPILRPPEKTQTILNTVYVSLSQRTANSLVLLTHKEDQPWYQIMKEHGVVDLDSSDEIHDKVPKNLIIPDEMIKQCFQNILHRIEKDEQDSKRETELT